VAVPNASTLTLGGFVDLFKSEHKLVLQELMLTVGDKSQMIYSVTLAQLAAASEANLARPLVELISETTKTPLTPATAFYPLSDIVFATVDGDDVKCAPVVLQLDW
tara:strand:+ start:66 stop:383 length:318 start_codon:yes stop_codon:yes gene_type:complete